jgi:hypothetical protein
MTVKQRVVALEDSARKATPPLNIAAAILAARHAPHAAPSEAQLVEWAMSKNPRLRALAAANRRVPR